MVAKTRNVGSMQNRLSCKRINKESHSIMASITEMELMISMPCSILPMRMLLSHQRGVLKHACPHMRRTDLFNLVQSHVRTINHVAIFHDVTHHICVLSFGINHHISHRHQPWTRIMQRHVCRPQQTMQTANMLCVSHGRMGRSRQNLCVLS